MAVQDNVLIMSLSPQDNIPACQSEKMISSFSMSSDFEISVDNIKPQGILYVRQEIKPPSIDICFCLSGQMSVKLNNLKEKIVIKQGQAAVWLNSGVQSAIEYPDGQTVRRIGLRIEMQSLNTVMENEPESVFPDLCSMCDECACNNKSSYCRIGEMSTSMQLAAHQVFNCRYSGIARKLYFESKTLELLTYVFTDLYSNKSSLLCLEERKKVHKARKIITSNLENPPSLLELSRKVGLNDCKLKSGFRKIYGMTVFDCLRRERLARAQQLLEEGNLSVAQVSYEVGYSSLSHFAKVFTRNFGVKPGAYLTEMRKNRQL